MVCGDTPLAQQQSPVTVRDSYMPGFSLFEDDQWQHWVCCCHSSSFFEVTCRDWIGPRRGSWRFWKLASMIGSSVIVTQTSIPSLPTCQWLVFEVFPIHRLISCSHPMFMFPVYLLKCCTIGHTLGWQWCSYIWKPEKMSCLQLWSFLRLSKYTCSFSFSQGLSLLCLLYLCS